MKRSTTASLAPPLLSVPFSNSSLALSLFCALFFLAIPSEVFQVRYRYDCGNLNMYDTGTSWHIHSTYII